MGTELAVFYTLSLHDALPICAHLWCAVGEHRGDVEITDGASCGGDRKPRDAGRRAGGSDRRRRPGHRAAWSRRHRSEDHTAELQSQSKLVCRLLLEKTNCTEP